MPCQGLLSHMKRKRPSIIAAAVLAVTLGGCEASSSSLSDLAENERIDSLQADIEQWRVGMLLNPGPPWDSTAKRAEIPPTSRRMDPDLDREWILKRAAEAGLSAFEAEVLLDRMRAKRDGPGLS